MYLMPPKMMLTSSKVHKFSISSWKVGTWFDFAVNFSYLTRFSGKAYAQGCRRTLT